MNRSFFSTNVLLAGVSMLAMVGADGGPMAQPAPSVIAQVEGSPASTMKTKPFLELAQASKGDETGPVGPPGPAGPKGEAGSKQIAPTSCGEVLRKVPATSDLWAACIQGDAAIFAAKIQARAATNAGWLATAAGLSALIAAAIAYLAAGRQVRLAEHGLSGTSDAF